MYAVYFCFNVPVLRQRREKHTGAVSDRQACSLSTVVTLASLLKIGRLFFAFPCGRAVNKTRHPAGRSFQSEYQYPAFLYSRMR